MGHKYLPDFSHESDSGGVKSGGVKGMTAWLEQAREYFGSHPDTSDEDLSAHLEQYSISSPSGSASTRPAPGNGVSSSQGATWSTKYDQQHDSVESAGTVIEHGHILPCLLSMALFAFVTAIARFRSTITMQPRTEDEHPLAMDRD